MEYFEQIDTGYFVIDKPVDECIDTQNFRKFHFFVPFAI